MSDKIKQCEIRWRDTVKSYLSIIQKLVKNQFVAITSEQG